MKKYISEQEYAEYEKMLVDLESESAERAERVDIARARGDLSENEEYHSERRQLERVQDTLQELASLKPNLIIVPSVDKTKISYGSAITLTSTQESTVGLVKVLIAMRLGDEKFLRVENETAYLDLRLATVAKLRKICTEINGHIFGNIPAYGRFGEQLIGKVVGSEIIMSPVKNVDTSVTYRVQKIW